MPDDMPSSISGYENYFEGIPVWENFEHQPEFVIDAASVFGRTPSGRIPVLKLRSWHDFARMLNHPFFSHPSKDWVFRGHRRYDWGLDPTLSRASSDGLISKGLAETQLKRFRKAIRGRLRDNALLDADEEDVQANNELWSIGQHHGLQTPLLDWTVSPYVALFFAFQGKDPDDEAPVSDLSKLDAQLQTRQNPFRAVYALNRGYIGKDNEFTDIDVIEPKKDDHGRLVNQAGLFVKADYGNTLEGRIMDHLNSDEMATDTNDGNQVAEYICKIYIPNDAPYECVQHLRQMNVHHASLFPDLIGASEYCNSLIGSQTKYDKIDRHLKSGDIDVLNEIDMRDIPVYEEPRHEEEDYKEAYEAISSKVGDGSIKPMEEIDFSLEEFQIVGTSARYEMLLTILEPDCPNTALLPQIIRELEYGLDKYLVIDWQKKDSAQAGLRNSIRRIMRRYKYHDEAIVSATETIMSIE